MDEKSHGLLRHSPAILTVFGGLVYGVGYLVVSLFHSRWGIMDTQPFRAEYIHIGFFCLTPPVAPGVLVWFYLHVRGKRPPKDPNGDEPVRETPPPSDPLKNVSLSGLMLLCILVPVLCWLALLAHPKTFGNDKVQFYLVVLPVVTIGGLLALPMIDWLLGILKWKETKPITDVKNLLCIAYVLVALFAGGKLLANADTSAAAMWKDHWYSLILYGVLSVLLLWLVARHIKHYLILPESNRAPTILVGSVIALPLLYFAVMAFAYGVYPYIPSTRGGGNYVNMAKVQVVALGSSGVELNGWKGTPLLQIMETDSTLYLTRWVADTTKFARPNNPGPDILVV